MGEFKDAILKDIAPELEPHGFLFEDSLRVGDYEFVFQADLGDSILAQIVITRRHDESRPLGKGFSIHLLRRNASQIADAGQGEYEGNLNEGLFDLLRRMEGNDSREGSPSWWDASAEAEFESLFQEAVTKLKRYAIPWLLDAETRNEWYIPRVDRGVLAEAILRQVSPSLQERGYEVLQDAQTIPPYFRKHLRESLFGFVTFHQGKLPGSPAYLLLVRLEAKHSPEIFPKPMQDGDQMSIPVPILLEELSILAARQQGTVRPDPASRGWTYSSEQELRMSLKDVTTKLVEYGLPWLENPNTKSLWTDFKKSP